MTLGTTMKNSLPLARKDALIVQELPDETLVYDQERDKAHCLNHPAALVWKHCDGETTIAEIAHALEKDLNTTIDDRVVSLALAELEKHNLLQTPAQGQENFQNVSRRRVVRTLGYMAVIPLITSIVAPAAGQAGSGLPPGACCVNPNDCQSGNCDPAGPGNCAPSDKICTV